MKISLILTLILLFITASSWSAPRKPFSKDYKDFEGKTFSNLRVQNKVFYELTFEDGRCLKREVLHNRLSPKIAMDNDPFDDVWTFDTKSIGMPFQPLGVDYLEYKLPAKTELIFRVKKYSIDQRVYKSCSHYGIYTFKSKKNYELLDNTGSDDCKFTINQIMKDGTRKEVKPIRLLSANNELDYCKLKK
ncbi:hypothetical protein [Acinetobacter shaoyimingii]|uniref:Uncharacterized protein n=1 Tax=Acinetobacter shaoyimingii TaxID=2715164 RepID=A0A6G8RXR3_9GAMM|nr:hypothetical protein [Acinetobacter shaoyimingii]QIO06640.1 hypothetical protein G8E00_12110 [Acinetobacter shaoyimingii]